MSKYMITLKSGAVLNDLSMNGSMFVSQDEITADVLNADALETVTISEIDEGGSTTETTLHNAVCDGILHWSEGWLFNLREPSAQEQQIAAMQNQIDMQTECILEMSEIIYG